MEKIHTHGAHEIRPKYKDQISVFWAFKNKDIKTISIIKSTSRLMIYPVSINPIQNRVVIRPNANKLTVTYPDPLLAYSNLLLTPNSMLVTLGNL